LTSRLAKEDRNLVKLNRLAENSLKVGFVGNFLVMKGIYEFIEAAGICIGKHLNVDFLIVGDNVRNIKGFRAWLLSKLNFWFDVKSDIMRLIENHNLNKSVHLLGFIDDIREFYESIDIICFPSHLNAVGRPVIEAAFSKVPAIVSITHPLGDTIIDGETGICIEPKDARGLAEAIERLYNKPDEIKSMGESAYKLAMKNFVIERNAKRVLKIYERYTQQPANPIIPELGM
jgi:glycosyltransferase involved in cell wall biosynthesis